MLRRPRPHQRVALPNEGDQVRIIANSNSHDYQIGKIYIVTSSRHENGEAFQARDPDTGKSLNWLTADDVVIVPRIGWQWLRTILPPQDVALLETFDGLDSLTLKQEIKDTILSDLPTLDHHIVTAQRSSTSPPKERPR